MTFSQEYTHIPTGKKLTNIELSQSLKTNGVIKVLDSPSGYIYLYLPEKIPNHNDWVQTMGLDLGISPDISLNQAKMVDGSWKVLKSVNSKS